MSIPSINFSGNWLLLNGTVVNYIKILADDTIVFYLLNNEIIMHKVYSEKVYNDIVRWSNERN